MTSVLMAHRDVKERVVILACLVYPVTEENLDSLVRPVLKDIEEGEVAPAQKVFL